MSVGLSEWNNSASTGRIVMEYEIWVFFSKTCPETPSFITIWQEERILHMKTNTHLRSNLAEFPEWDVSDKVVEEIYTHILRSIGFFLGGRKSCRVWDNVEKSGYIWQYGACALHPGYLGLQTYTQHMSYLLLLHCNNGCTKATKCS